MDYEIFDKSSIALGLLTAFLAAQCIILYVKANTIRGKMDSTIDELVRAERMKAEARKMEMEAELKERGMRLETEYASLISEARKKFKESEARLAEASAVRAGARRSFDANRANEEHLLKLKAKYETGVNEYMARLSELGGIDPAKASELYRAELARQAEDDAGSYRAQIFSKSAEELDLEAREILADVMQRAAVPMNPHLNTSIVRLPHEAMKGRLIGKDGRNIRSFEAATETTLVIDETPDSVMLSSFDPARREVARIALEHLIKDGRINPATIESAVASAKSEIEKRALDAGMSAAEQLGVRRLATEVMACLGKLSFHMSLNQNSLEHSVECARIASLLAAELSCDSALAKRAALLHDIGKVIDSEKPHAAAGAEFLLKHGESEIVAAAVGEHHDGFCRGGIYSAIVRIADSISATRPGARMVPADGYFQRVKSLEDIAMSFPGVISAYALQSGRELRIIVEPDTVDDALAKIISSKVRERVLEELDTSVPVKITLIREKRFVETASRSDSQAAS